jgi:mono/diheme cytochrome c family protein
MKRSARLGVATLFTLLAVSPRQALAQPQPAAPSLNATQLEGRNLFTQHCVVCHVRTLVTAVRSYGPPLSKDSLGGQEDVLRELISNGTPNMPGFKYNFDAGEIGAIIAYLKTLPPQGAPAAR